MWAANTITDRQNKKHAKPKSAGRRPRTARTARPRTATPGKQRRPRPHPKPANKKKYHGVKKYYAPLLKLMPKLLVSIGLFFIFMGVIITCVGVTKAMNYPTGRTSGPILLVFGLGGFVGGIVWIRKRSRERKRREQAEFENKRSEYANDPAAAKYVTKASTIDDVSALSASAYVNAGYDQPQPSTSGGLSGAVGGLQHIYEYDHESDSDGNDVTGGDGEPEVQVSYVECDLKDRDNVWMTGQVTADDSGFNHI